MINIKATQSYQMINLPETLSYIKKHKISYKTIRQKTGYSIVHICAVLKGKKPCTLQFSKLLELVLNEYGRENKHKKLFNKEVKCKKQLSTALPS